MIELSEQFSPDISSETGKKHNEEAEQVYKAYLRGKPERVPFICGEWIGQHGFYADEIGLDYRKYYTNPDLMIQVQLEAARRRRELPLHDNIPICKVPTESWCVGVDLWPVIAAGWLGCPIEYNKITQIANRSLHLSKEECDMLQMPDLTSGGLLATMNKFYKHMVGEYANKLCFLGKTVDFIQCMAGSNGVFSLALDLRGENIMTDMYEDSEFVHRFLNKLADWIESLEIAWQKGVQKPYSISDHGTDMLSPETYEEFIIPILLRKNKNSLDKKHDFHHCGVGQKLFPVIAKYFKINSVHAVTYPTLNIEKIREDVGEDAWVIVCLDEGILKYGKPDDVRYAVKQLLTDKVKGSGGISIMSGDLVRGVNMDNMYVLYDAIREYGCYKQI